MVGRVIRVKACDIRRVWQDTELTLQQASERLGMSTDTLQARAAALGLKTRRTGRREVIRPHQEREFRLMWKAGVGAREIALAFGCSYFAVINTSARLGLAMRGPGYHPKLTILAFREAQLGVALVHVAAKEAAVRRGAYQ